MPDARPTVRDILRLVNRASNGHIGRTVLAAIERWLGRHHLQGALPGHERVRYGLTIPGLLGPFHLAASTLPVVGWAFDMARGVPLRMRVQLGRQRVVAARDPRPDLVIAFAPVMHLSPRCGAEAELAARFGPSLLRIEIETAPRRWETAYRAIVLGCGARARASDLGPNWRYEDWRIEAQEREERSSPVLPPSRYRVTAIVIGDDADAVDATLAGLRSQSVGSTAILVGAVVRAGYENAPDFATALALASEDAVLPLRAGDRLRQGALGTLLAALESDARPDLVYGDEESEQEGTFLPYFKPDWSPDTLEAFNYIGAPALYGTGVARGLPARSAYDLALRVTERTQRVVHLPAMLCQRAAPATFPVDPEGDRLALLGRLERTGRAGRVATIHRDFAARDCSVALPEPLPLVSIVIPTAGRELDIDGRRIDLVVDCVRSIQQRSTYANLEFIVVANTDMPRTKAETLTALGCGLVVYDEPVLNVARKLNIGAAQARGAFVLLLNDDIEVVAPDWIERLVVQASKPHVGVVGAKLLYPDLTIQHAGVVLHGGNPHHVRRLFPRDEFGYFFSTCAPRNYLAVTGACMMARSEVFREVGGYTEALAVNFNDVDFCLKVRALGLHVVYEPGCELIHYESVSRSSDFDAGEHRYFLDRWSAAYPRDPFYDTSAFGLLPPSYEIVMRRARAAN